MTPADRLGDLVGDIVTCRACPRLVAWREQVARERVARFRHDTYWGRPVPGFGDPDARVLVVGLAPAAHGGNRTGRVFTGDGPGVSGELLFPALHATGFASRERSVSAGDGLRLHDAWIAAVNRCAPPANKPTPGERDRCLPFLVRELALLERVRVVVCLGAWGWDGALRALAAAGHRVSPTPRFGHGVEAAVGPYRLLGCYHPSQQNTFTGRVDREMVEAVLRRAAELAGGAA
ncbi:MAG: uracil-DNA glycosylase [Chloroflexota bacterium]